MENEAGQLCDEENSFKEDMITLRPGREHAWLDDMVERVLQTCWCGLLRVSTLIPVASERELLKVPS